MKGKKPGAAGAVTAWLLAVLIVALAVALPVILLRADSAKRDAVLAQPDQLVFRNAGSLSPDRIVLTGEGAARFEQECAAAQGWRPALERNAALCIFDGAEPDYGHTVSVGEGWQYFFCNHNGEDDAKYTDSGADRIDLIWNCTAAVYDPATHTLYYFDHDM